MEPRRLLLIGFGNVGRKLVELYNRIIYPWMEYVSISGVCDSSGCIVSKEGFKRGELTGFLRIGRGMLGKMGWKSYDIPGAIEVAKPHIVVDVRPSNYKTPHTDIYALQESHRYHIVTANKAPLAIMPELITDNPLREMIHYRATFMAGTPLFDLLVYGSAGRTVSSVRGVFNTTTTFLLTLREQGYSFNEALDKAVQEGVAEPDPSIDVDCIDPAAKTAIISATLGYPVGLDGVARRSIREYWEIDGFVRCVSRIDVQANRAEAYTGPEVIGSEDPIRQAVGKNNVAIVKYGDGGKVTLTGSGGGPLPTAVTLWTDVYKAVKGLW